jgi:tagatose 6-phosphate kinase
MIVVVCLNPALDITHHVRCVDWAGVNRPTAVYTRPGGKGTNVARTLHALGADALLLGFAGGTTGSAVEAGLRELAVPAAFTPVAAETRRTFTVVDGQGIDFEGTGFEGGQGAAVALFNEPGPEVSAAEWARFRDEYGQTLSDASVVTLSGSLPRGLPSTAYAQLIAMAAEAGVPTVLDTSGDALRASMAAGPAIVKPNLDELRAVSGQPLTTPAGEPDQAAVRDAASALRTAGAAAVVVSLGASGLLAVTGHGDWHAAPPALIAGNATGAGDAVIAALAHGLLLGRPWPERLAHAAALGAATVAAPVAGEFSHAAYTDGLRSAAVTQRAAWAEVGDQVCGRKADWGEGDRCQRPLWRKLLDLRLAQGTASARSMSPASSTRRRSSPARRPPPLRWCCR